MKKYLKLIRINQWYKNTIIFAPLLFSNQTHPLPILVIGFLGFACISSMSYIVNDWMDREKDRLHPIKKERPLASGKISGKQAILVSFMLAGIVALAMSQLGLFYSSILACYFVLTNLYSFGLKNIPLLDILMIATNFALRMMAGITDFPEISGLAYFGFLLGAIVIFLTHKRSDDIKSLGEKAIKHKPVLRFYTPQNNYFFRAAGYLIFIVSLFILWQNGLHIIKSFGIHLQLFITSIIFSDNSSYTSKPKYLFKSKVWVGMLLINVLIFWLI